MQHAAAPCVWVRVKLRDRIYKALVPLGLSVTLVAAGCEMSTPPPTEEVPIEFRSTEPGPSAWALTHGDAIADAIVADSRFDQLINVAVDVMGDLHAAQQELSDEEVHAITVTTTDPAFAETMDPHALLGHLGGNPEDIDRTRLLIDQLRADHGLMNASPDDAKYVFELALASEGGQAMLIAAVQAGAQGEDWGPCEEVCYAAYLYMLTIIVAFFIAMMVVAAATVPWGIIIALFAVAWFNDWMAHLTATLNACLAECEGISVDLDLCGGEAICADDEYCWTGVAGIGADECRPKKPQGNVCANHEQCTSGCCKYHFMSHPVSKVCRPANKCN